MPIAIKPPRAAEIKPERFSTTARLPFLTGGAAHGLALSMEFLALTFPQIEPVIWQFGPIAIRWYGLAYLAGNSAACGRAWLWPGSCSAGAMAGG